MQNRLDDGMVSHSYGNIERIADLNRKTRRDFVPRRCF